MTNAQQLIDQACSVAPAGEDILAAGVFAVQDDYLATALAAIGGSAVASELLDNSVAEGLGAGAGVRATREGDKEMKLTGGIGLLATYKDGNKKVVEALSS